MNKVVTVSIYSLLWRLPPSVHCS